MKQSESQHSTGKAYIYNKHGIPCLSVSCQDIMNVLLMTRKYITKVFDGKMCYVIGARRF